MHVYAQADYSFQLTGTAKGLGQQHVRLSCPAWIEDKILSLDAMGHLNTRVLWPTQLCFHCIMERVLCQGTG